MKTSYLLLLLLLASISPAVAQNFARRTVAGEQNARQQVLAATKETAPSSFPGPLLPTKAAAIAVAEPLLFKTYGKQHIMQERPYEAYLIDGYWYIAGTLPEGYRGGTFEIILAASDGRVLRLTHYK